MTKPTCCGQPAKWVHINHRMEYWFCEKCKKEVQEHKNVPETSDDQYGRHGLAGYTPPAAGSYKRAVHVAFSGGLGGAGSLGSQPVKPAPQPLVLGQRAQFTNGIDTPCYNNYIHCWTGKTSYDMGIACACGERVKALSPPPLTQPGPIPLDPTCEMPICDDPTPCSAAVNVHFWSYRRRYEADLPCNCGLRVKY